MELRQTVPEMNKSRSKEYETHLQIERAPDTLEAGDQHVYAEDLTQTCCKRRNKIVI